MVELTVECKKRPEGSKPNSLRRQGQLPAVLYGHNGAESVALVLDTKSAETLVRRAAINNTLVNLSVPELSWSGKALLREVQKHPWKGSLYHLSFFSVGAQESLAVTIPLHFSGTATGVKNGGGTLDAVLTELEVQCAPDNIPETIDVDVTDLEVGAALHVNQLTLPQGITVLGEGDRVVVSVLAPKVASEDTESEAAE